MAGFGALSALADEHRRVLGVIEEEFERVPGISVHFGDHL